MNRLRRCARPTSCYWHPRAHAAAHPAGKHSNRRPSSIRHAPHRGCVQPGAHARAFGRRATRVRSGPTRSIRRAPHGLSRVSTKQYSCKEHYAPRHAQFTLPVPAGASAVRYCAVLTQCTLRRTSETFAQRDPGQPIGFQQAQSTAHGGGSVLWRCRWRSCCGRPRRASSSCSARQRGFPPGVARSTARCNAVPHMAAFIAT